MFFTSDPGLIGLPSYTVYDLCYNLCSVDNVLANVVDEVAKKYLMCRILDITAFVLAVMSLQP